MEIMKMNMENVEKGLDLAEEENAEKFSAKSSNDNFTALPKPLIWVRFCNRNSNDIKLKD